MLTWTVPENPRLTTTAAARTVSAIGRLCPARRDVALTPTQAIPRRMDGATPCGAWRLLMGMVCALAGTIALVAGLSDFVRLEFATPGGWHEHTRDSVVPVAPVHGIASLADEQGPGGGTEPLSRLKQSWAVLAPPLQPVGEASRPASRSFAGDELIPGPAVSIEERDLRLNILEMSAAQHTGRWTFALPMLSKGA
jgi:hypothetical protein